MDPFVKIVGLGSAGENIAKKLKEKLDALVLGGAFGGSGPRVLIVVAGLGGCSGSIAVKEIVEKSRKDFDTIGVFVSTPFQFEGVFRKKLAQSTLDVVKRNADFYYCCDCDRVAQDFSGSTAIYEVFRKVDELIIGAVCDFVRLVKNHRHKIFVDYDDVRAIIGNRQKACCLRYLSALASGENWGNLCLEALTGQCEKKVGTCRGVVFWVEHDESLTLLEYNDFVEQFYEQFVDENDEPGVIVSDFCNDNLKNGGKISVMIFEDGEN